MPEFKAHISFGAAIGLLGVVFAVIYQVPVSGDIKVLSIFAITFGSMLPDLDSDAGKPFRFSLEAFALLGVAMYFFGWLNQAPRALGSLLFGAVIVYAATKYIIGAVIKKVTHHRGIFHSIPALGIVVLVTMLLLDGVGFSDREILFAALSVGVGYFSHLFLDDMGVRFKLKGIFWGKQESRVRAMKVVSSSRAATLFAYLILVVLVYSNGPMLKAYYSLFEKIFGG